MLNFTAIDFETANPARGSVCAVGVTKVIDASVVFSSATLVRPPPDLAEFNPYNQRVHHISAADVTDAPDWPQVLPHLLKIIGDDVVLAHNAAFERSVLTGASHAHQLAPPALPTLCTVKCAKALLPDLPRHKLPVLAAHLGIEVRQHHDAGDDARVCAQIAIALAGLAAADDVADLADRAGQQVVQL